MRMVGGGILSVPTLPNPRTALFGSSRIALFAGATADPWAPFDGRGQAPSGTPQLSTLLNNYVPSGKTAGRYVWPSVGALNSSTGNLQQAPWRVAGVDYAVGQSSAVTVFGSTSVNPTQAQLNLASQGATISGGTVTLTGANPSLGSSQIGFVFASNTKIVVSGATGTATIQNCVLTLLNVAGWQGISVLTGTNANLVVKYCEINGGQFSDSTGQNTDAAVSYLGNGNYTCWYNYLHGLPVDAFQCGTGNSTYDIRYNLIYGIGYAPSGGGGGHPDALQIFGGTSGGVFAYNTIVSPPGSGQSGDNELVSNQAQNTGVINNPIWANNTIIAQGSSGSPTASILFGSFVEDAGSRINGSQYIYNFMDDTGTQFTAFYAVASSLQVTTGTTNLYEGNIDLVTGSSTNPTSVGYVPAGSTTASTGAVSTDVSSATASPSTGTVSTGSSITFTLNYVRPVTGALLTLTLSNGATATYTGGSGTSALTFIYTVQSGDASATNLAISAVNGNIIDQFGNPVSQTAALVTFSGLNIGSSASSAFPGQPGNPVGFAAPTTSVPAAFTTAGGKIWPGAYPGSLTTFGAAGSHTFSNGTGAASGSGTAGDPWVFAFLDIVGTNGSLTTLSLSNAIFVGCRFQNQSTGISVNAIGAKTSGTATNVNLIYCSFTPLAANYTSPPGASWPSAGAGQNTTTQTNNVNAADPTLCNQFSFSHESSTGTVTFDHCDFWGFTNGAINTGATTGLITFTDCWIHDTGSASSGAHQDGIGYFNGGTGPKNVLVRHCTIAALGNTQAIGFQTSTGGYNNITIDQCYLAGYGYMIGFDTTHGFTNITFTNNTIGSDLQWTNGITFADYSTAFSQATNTWKNNKFNFVTGTVPASGSVVGSKYTSANNGQFVLPSTNSSSIAGQAYRATDF